MRKREYPPGADCKGFPGVSVVIIKLSASFESVVGVCLTSGKKSRWVILLVEEHEDPVIQAITRKRNKIGAL